MALHVVSLESFSFREVMKLESLLTFNLFDH